MTILILGDSKDPHAQAVKDALAQKRISTAVLDTSDFPQKASISWYPQEACGQITCSDGTSLRLDEIKAVYWRSLNFPKIPRCEDPYQAMLAERDCMSTLRTFLNGARARWINSWAAYDGHKEKPLQLAQVHALGVKIPQTIVSNAPKDILDFYHQHPEVIFKPVYGGAHTEFLTEAHVAYARLEQVLRTSPITLQAYIPGTNIRTYVVGNKVFSAEIRTESVDFREDEGAQLLPISLPHGLTEKCLAITKALRLAWTAIDWRRTPAGEYYFLEANPSPMFLHFEQVTGYPIMASLIELLTGTQQDHDYTNSTRDNRLPSVKIASSG